MCPTFWVWRGWAQSLARRAIVAPSAVTPMRPLARDTPLLYLPTPSVVFTRPPPPSSWSLSALLSPPISSFPTRQLGQESQASALSTGQPESRVGARLMFPFLPGSSPDLMTRVEGKEHFLAFLSPHGLRGGQSAPGVTAGHGAGRAGAGAGRLPRPGQPQSQKWVV